MNEIHIIHHPDERKLVNLGVTTWPVWSKEVSEFPWFYDAQETCYILEGKVTVTPVGGVPVQIEAGDLVTFPKGMSCIWQIHQDIKKHYTFAEL